MEVYDQQFKLFKFSTNNHKCNFFYNSYWLKHSKKNSYHYRKALLNQRLATKKLGKYKAYILKEWVCFRRAALHCF